MPDLADDIESLKALIQRLWGENAQLKAENAELRRRLGMDSNNSHKPPSSDGLKKNTTQPGLPKRKNSTNGGQAGHKGNTLKHVIKAVRYLTCRKSLWCTHIYICICSFNMNISLWIRNLNIGRFKALPNL
jgi:hypothetical protein